MTPKDPIRIVITCSRCHQSVGEFLKTASGYVCDDCIFKAAVAKARERRKLADEQLADRVEQAEARMALAELTRRFANREGGDHGR